MWLLPKINFSLYLDWTNLIKEKLLKSKVKAYFSIKYCVAPICKKFPWFIHSHKNGKIVWKHGPYNAFYSSNGWSLCKGVRKNKNSFRQGRFSLQGWPRCCLSNNWCRYVWEWCRYGIRDCSMYQKSTI